LAAAVALAVGCCALVVPGHARAAESSECAGEKALYELYTYALELESEGKSDTQPPNGAEVPQHSAATLSGESGVPLSFEIAPGVEERAGKQALKHPLIDSGTGTASPGTNATKYTFVSTKATSIARTVYWDAAFTAELKHCESPTMTFRTNPRALEVIGHSEEATPPPPVESRTTTYSPPSPTGLKVGITASRLVHIGRPAVAYLVDCTAACGGQTSVRAWELRGRGKPVRVSALDFGPRAVSIPGSSGGNQRFTQRFRGRALKKLRGMLRGGHEMKLVVTATVKDSAGDSVQAQRVILLKR
jgi:hypothetical protein